MQSVSERLKYLRDKLGGDYLPYIDIVEILFHDKKRKISNRPYSEHLITTAYNLHRIGCRPDVVLMGLFHDVYEDLSEKQIESYETLLKNTVMENPLPNVSILNYNMINVVIQDDLTNDPEVMKELGRAKIRYLSNKILRMHPKSALIKGADRLSNLQDMVFWLDAMNHALDPEYKDEIRRKIIGQLHETKEILRIVQSKYSLNVYEFDPKDSVYDLSKLIEMYHMIEYTIETFQLVLR